MDQSTKDFTINAGLLGALGALWQGTPTTVSPFQYGKEKTPGMEEKAQLAAAGACDANGQIAPGLKPALDVLGNAQAFTRMYITGGLNAYEYIVYFGGDGKTASLININGDVQINCPSIADLFIEMATQTLGSTVFRSATVETSLTPVEACVLAAIIDLQRQAFLKALADSSEAEIVAPALSAIEAVLSRKGENYQWLNNVIRDLAGSAASLSRGQIATALETLTTKGLVTKAGSGFQLSNDSLLLARRMLVFDSSIVLTSGHLGPDGVVSVAGFTCLQAGVHDLLYIDANAGVVELQSVSSAAVLEYIRVFMTDPAVLKRLDTAVPSGQQAPSTVAYGPKFCPSCGTAVQPGKKFCPQCGATII